MLSATASNTDFTRKCRIYKYICFICYVAAVVPAYPLDTVSVLVDVLAAVTNIISWSISINAPA